MTLTTPVATIGIRGTQIGIIVDDNGTQVSLMEEAGGFVGEIIVEAVSGELLVINQKNNTVIVNTDDIGNMVVFTDAQIVDAYGKALSYLEESMQVLDEDIEALNDFTTDAGVEEIPTTAQDIAPESDNVPTVTIIETGEFTTILNQLHDNFSF